jgi:hypothetical protein
MLVLGFENHSNGRKDFPQHSALVVDGWFAPEAFCENHSLPEVWFAQFLFAKPSCKKAVLQG